MGILEALGVDSTIAIQFVVFMFVYFVLHFVLFKPYFLAYIERKQRTVGNTDVAERVTTETRDLEVKYEQKARELNSQHKGIYDASRTEALKEYDRLVSEAREDAKITLEQSRERLRNELKKARAEVEQEIPVVTQAITTKMLGKDL